MNNQYLNLLSFFVLSLLGFPAYAGAQQQGTLDFMGAYPIENAIGLEPSGLTSCKGELLFISDSNDKSIFKLTQYSGAFRSELAYVLNEIPAKDISMYPPDRQALIRFAQQYLENYIDWEGISCGEDNRLLLASETFADILSFRTKPKHNKPSTEWLESPIYTDGVSQGWFQMHNAYIEGIAVDEDLIYVAAERQPRGLARLEKDNGQWEISTVNPPVSPIPPTGTRPSDFADIVKYDDYLLTLERNASSVCARDEDNLVVIKCWSYEHIENNSLYAYSNTRFGLGEGIAVHKGRLYIVLDNNNDTRQIDPMDSRSQIFEFKLPTIDD